MGNGRHGCVRYSSWWISVCARTAINGPSYNYDLLSSRITSECQLLTLAIAIPAVDMSAPAPLSPLQGLGSNLRKEERTNLRQAFLTSGELSSGTTLVCSASLTGRSGDFSSWGK